MHLPGSTMVSTMAQEWDCVMLCMVMGKIVPRLEVRAERRKTSDGEGKIMLSVWLCAPGNQNKLNLFPQAPHLKRICAYKL